MKIPYKNPRAVCHLCGKEWAVRNINPRYHHCPGLPTPVPAPPLPHSSVVCGVSVDVNIADLQRYMTAAQIQAVMNGLALVIAAQK